MIHTDIYHRLQHFLFAFNIYGNSIGGVMVSMLASSAVDRGVKPDQVKSMSINLVFVTSPLSIKEKEQRLVGSKSG